MGCFSFMCKNSDEPVNSDSFKGDAVHLFLLKDGKVIEEMYGNYNSYGAVFDGKDGSFEWKTPWDKVCDLMFSSNPGDGIAAILHPFYGGETPTTQSDGDPDQGWGKMKYSKKVKEPFHQIF